MNANRDDLIRRFLLGDLSEQERDQVEAQFMADNELFEEILSAEDALLEQYLEGQLSDEQLERARTLFHSSPRQERELEFTKGLIASLRASGAEKEQTTSDVTQTVPAKSTVQIPSSEELTTAKSKSDSSANDFPLIQPGFFNQFAGRPATIGWLSVLLVCLVLLSWIVYLYSQKRSWEVQLAAVERSNQEAREKLREATQGHAELSKQLEDERERRAKAEELIAQLQIPKPGGSTNLGSITSLVLIPATLERGGNAKTVKLTAETKRIQLQLQLGANQRYGKYSVHITTFDGRNVWSDDSIGAGQIKRGRLTLVLLSSLLEYDDYRIELKGLPDSGEPVHVADYIFKVRK